MPQIIKDFFLIEKWTQKDDFVNIIKTNTAKLAENCHKWLLLLFLFGMDQNEKRLADHDQVQTDT